MAHVEVEGLTVRYGAVAALDGLDLSIASGEMFVLLGGSGSGKTTLLRALGGFVRPDAGRISLAGQDITGLPPHRRPVNTTFQSYALFPHMSVADNVAFGLRRQGAARAAVAARVRELLDLVRLGEFAARRPDALSGGQRQRVALARALAPRPQLLLLDEPLSALDRSLREQTRRELLRVQRSTGTTFVLVTHDQDEALAMATRIGLLRGGRLAQVGTPADIYERPASRYVAEFMGAANLLPGRAGPGGVVELDGIGPVRAGAPLPPGAAVCLAVRPERLRVGPVGAAPGSTALGSVNEVAGRIAESVYRGGVLDHQVRLANGAVLTVSQVLDGTPPPRPGDAVTVSWPPDACVLLPE